ncbi:MAG: BrnT family toxin, partial [Deltaproteobacteria bacterium]|nr:BrnT family toxin [Deltaproteobacteria bacterium]
MEYFWTTEKTDHRRPTVNHQPEQRPADVGSMHGAYWTAIITHRTSAIRVISVRHDCRKRTVTIMKKESASDAKKEIITAEEFDRRFEAGEYIAELVDWEAARHTGLETRRLTVD